MVMGNRQNSGDIVEPLMKLDTSGIDDVNSAKTFLEKLNSTAIWNELGTGRVLRAEGLQDPDMLRLLKSGQYADGTDSIPKVDLRVESSTFRDKKHADLIARKTAFVMKTLRQVAYDICMDNGAHFNKEADFHKLINSRWSLASSGTPLAALYPMTNEVITPNGKKVDIEILVHSEKFKSSFGRDETYSYVLLVELKFFDNKECSHGAIADQMCQYVDGRNVRDNYPIAMMLLYVARRPVTQDAVTQMHVDRPRQLHANYWGLRSKLRRHNRATQEAWAQYMVCITPSSAADDAFSRPLEGLTDEEPHVETPMFDESSEDDDDSEYRNDNDSDDAMAVDTPNGNRYPSRTPRAIPALPLPAHTAVVQKQPFKSKAKAGAKKSTVRNDYTDSRDANRAVHATAVVAAAKSVRSTELLDNRDPGKYTTAATFNFGIGDNNHHHLDPNNLKGLLMRKHKIVFNPGRDWGMQTSGLSFEESDENLIFSDAVGPTDDVTYQWVAVQDPSYGSPRQWVVGRIIRMQHKQDCIYVGITFPGWSDKNGPQHGYMTLKMDLGENGAANMQNKCFFSHCASTKSSKDWSIPWKPETSKATYKFCIFTSYALSYDDVFLLHKLRKEHETREQFISDHQHDVDETATEIQTYKDDILRLTGKQRDSDDSLRAVQFTLDTQRENLRQADTDLEVKIAYLKSILVAIDTDQKSTLDRIHLSASAGDRMQHKLERVYAENNKLDEKIRLQNQYILKIKQELVLLAESAIPASIVEELRAGIESQEVAAQAQLNDLHSEVGVHRKIADRMGVSLLEMRRDNSKLCEQLDGSKEAHTVYQCQVQVLEQTIAENMKIVESLQAELNTATEANMRVHKELNSAIADKNNSQEKLAESVADTTNKVAQLETAMTNERNTSVREKGVLDAKIVQLKDEQKTTMTIERNASVREKDVLDAKIVQLKGEQKTSTRIRGELETKLALSIQSVTTADTKILRLEKIIADTASQSVQNKELNAIIAETSKRSVADAQYRVAELTRTCETQRNAVKVADKRVADLQQDLATAVTEHEELQRVVRRTCMVAMPTMSEVVAVVVPLEVVVVAAVTIEAMQQLLQAMRQLLQQRLVVVVREQLLVVVARELLAVARQQQQVLPMYMVQMAQV
ncbi:hypothetical protein T484DRAFT_1756554 [Baffinella frigidus]|nr:hypothetical protein T484DRAFT_1756554 [Cryptophyta sp. CCMP2293]